MTNIAKPLNKPSEPDLETICRLCLLPETGSINIFQSELSIPVRIMACAALEVRNGDGLPGLICEKCRYQLEVSYYFRKKCQISDGKLRKHIRLLNAGKKSRIFVKPTNDDDDEPDEEELQCEESIKFIEEEEIRKKSVEDEKNRKWLEEQREQMRQEDAQRLFEEFGTFMKSRIPVEKKEIKLSSPYQLSATTTQYVLPARRLTPTPPLNKRQSQKEQLQQAQSETISQRQTSPDQISPTTPPQYVSPKIRQLSPTIKRQLQKEQFELEKNETISHAQPQQALQQEEQFQPEIDDDHEITSSEQIPDEQEQEQDQEQHQAMFYSDDDNGEVENSELMVYHGKGNEEDDGNNQIIQVENDDDDDPEIAEMMSQEEECIAEDVSDENEMEGKANNDAEEMDEFIFLADFEDSNHGACQSEREVDSYQIEENGEIQYVKEERPREDEIHSNQLDNSSDSKYVVEDVAIINVQKFNEKLPSTLDKKKKLRKIQIPVTNKIVTFVNDNDLKIFKCNDCPQSFTRANSLLRHRSAHKGGRDYCCDYCDKYFSCKSSLDRHIRIHTGEKPYTCDVCGKNFMQKEILKRHITIHTGNRPHQCPHCPRSFVQKLLMNQHINAVHLPVPQLTKNICHLCPKSFLHPSGLSRHLLTHKGMVFTCPLCGRSFNDKSSLRRHYAAVHAKHNEKTVVPKAEPDENESSNEYLIS